MFKYAWWPNSINPDTGKPYGLDFPVITFEDAVRVQKKLIDYLGVKKLIVAGGSMGGMQAIEWSVSYPEMVKKTIVIASTSRLSAQAIAFNAVGRNAILSDSNFNHGSYYEGKMPEKGLAIARMIGHITYLSEGSMHNKFARNLQDKDKFAFDFPVEFQVESYLQHQGQVFVDRFDANSYLYITKACDYYDVALKYGSLEKAFEHIIFDNFFFIRLVVPILSGKRNCKGFGKKWKRSFIFRNPIECRTWRIFIRIWKTNKSC